MKIGKEFFGEKKVTNKLLPLYGSEDFSFFLKEKPGCYFLLGSGRKEDDDDVHTSNFNFNDDLIPIASDFWIKIAEERLGLEKYLGNYKLENVDKNKEEKILNDEKEKLKNSSKKIKKK